MSINNVNPKYDIARSDMVGTRSGVAPLFTGAAQICADSAPAKALFSRYELVALEADGLAKFVVGTHNAANAVIVSQVCDKIGQQIPYWNEGEFNYDAVKWPTHASLDSIAKLKAFFNGTNIKVGHTI